MFLCGRGSTSGRLPIGCYFCFSISVRPGTNASLVEGCRKVRACASLCFTPNPSFKALRFPLEHYLQLSDLSTPLHSFTLSLNCRSLHCRYYAHYIPRQRPLGPDRSCTCRLRPSSSTTCANTTHPIRGEENQEFNTETRPEYVHNDVELTDHHQLENQTTLLFSVSFPRRENSISIVFDSSIRHPCLLLHTIKE